MELDEYGQFIDIENIPNYYDRHNKEWLNCSDNLRNNQYGSGLLVFIKMVVQFCKFIGF